MAAALLAKRLVHKRGSAVLKVLQEAPGLCGKIGGERIKGVSYRQARQAVMVT